MRTAIYPGTFDPITNGHLHIAERSCKLYDRIIIAVANDNYKNNLFSLPERMVMLEESTRHLPNVEVCSFTGLLADYAREIGAVAVIRGLRAISDFEYEMQMAAMNKHLNHELETVFLMAEGDYAFLSSSMIKQVALIGAKVDEMVPSIVNQYLKEKYNLGIQY
ncbi:MAG: pantetheine-phosphate adenylyltransferase [Peptococcia bacterium]|jgi:pantetheine-phosphate adenylyltransferase